MRQAEFHPCLMPTIRRCRMVQTSAGGDQLMNDAKSKRGYEAVLKQATDLILEMIGGLTA